MVDSSKLITAEI